MTEEVKNFEKQENNKPKRDEKGRLLPGNTANISGRPKGTRDWKTDFNEAIRVIAEETGNTISEVRTAILVRGVSEARKGNFNFWNHIVEREYGKIRQGIDFKDQTEYSNNKLHEILKNAKPEQREKVIGLLGQLIEEGDNGDDISSGSNETDRGADISEDSKDEGLETGKSAS
jgi:hypothetical protein